VKKQDSSIECIDSCAAKLNSVSSVRTLARQMIEREFSWFDHRDRLVVEGSFLEVRMLYVCAKRSSSAPGSPGARTANGYSNMHRQEPVG